MKENEHVYLLKPTIEFEAEYLSYFNEWMESGEEVIPWVVSKDPTDFKRMVQDLLDAEQGINLPQGWVPDSTYWLVREEDDKILGVTNIRHSLTEHLMNAGGHIGYGIRPSERRKGYAKKILELSLKKTDNLGIDKVLVVCDATNEGSAKTILHNGGLEDEQFVEESGNVVRRFWIDRKAGR